MDEAAITKVFKRNNYKMLRERPAITSWAGATAGGDIAMADTMKMAQAVALDDCPTIPKLRRRGPRAEVRPIRRVCGGRAARRLSRFSAVLTGLAISALLFAVWLWLL